MTDLAVLVPSRGRPKNVIRLREACLRTCRADTVLHFGFDNDDPQLTENLLAAAEGCVFTTSDRMGLVAWTNHLAAMNPRASYLASLGDDMVPITDGWDEILLDAQADIGGGFTYPDDRRRNDIPEAVVIDRRIVDGLGWMSEPSLDHWYGDNVWADLGSATGSLRYVPSAIVEHRHPNVPGGDPVDATYHQAAQSFAADLARYQQWRLRRSAQDIATVRRVREQAADPL
jgi:hypothetical protein